jgi:hypothetical protein
VRGNRQAHVDTYLPICYTAIGVRRDHLLQRDFAMLSSLAIRLVTSFSAPIAELSSPGPTSQVRPTSLQLALIGVGTLAVYALVQRARTARRLRRSEVPRQALDAVTAHVAAPHFSETAAPTAAKSVEDAA